jgi:hypothetical protein
LTTNQILTGVGLIFALAAGSQVLASRLRIPAIIVLLPVGFVAGALTPDVDPQRLLGPAFEPLAAATGRGARLEGITAVLLLTDEDDFNALASVLLADTVGERVYRSPPHSGAMAWSLPRRRSRVTPWCPWAPRSQRSQRIPVEVSCLR